MYDGKKKRRDKLQANRVWHYPTIKIDSIRDRRHQKVVGFCFAKMKKPPRNGPKGAKLLCWAWRPEKRKKLNWGHTPSAAQKILMGLTKVRYGPIFFSGSVPEDIMCFLARVDLHPHFPARENNTIFCNFCQGHVPHKTKKLLNLAKLFKKTITKV